jgi:hypothetical protein
LIYFTDLYPDIEIIFAYKKRYISQELFLNNAEKYYNISVVPKIFYYHEFSRDERYNILIFHKK